MTVVHVASIAPQNTSSLWDARARGLLCHQALALAARSDAWSRVRAEGAAAAVLPPDLSVVHRSALLTFLVTALGTYALHFRRQGWRFEDAEVVVGGEAALDLLWRRGSRWFADEVKSSLTFVPDWAPRAREQARTQLAAGRRQFGRGFEGVRVVAIADPPASFWERP